MANLQKEQKLPRLRAETDEPIFFDRTTPLFVRTGVLKVRVWFRIIENLKYDILFGMRFIEWCIHRIFCFRVFLWLSTTVPILSRNNSAPVQFHILEQKGTKVSVKLIWIARQTGVPRRLRTFVPATASVPEVFQLEPASDQLVFSILRVSTGIPAPTETRTCPVLIWNISATPRHLPKHMLLASGVLIPPFVVSINENKGKQERFRTLRS